MKLIIILLFVNSTYSLASTNWNNILLTYDYHFKGKDGIKVLTSPKGEEIINQVQSFISNPKNKEKLKTPDGQILINNHKKYINFLASKKTLDECQNNKSSKRNLEDIVLTGILTSSTSPDNDHCKTELLTSFANLSEIQNQINNITNKQLIGPLQDNLYEKSILNTLDAYLSGKYRYDESFFATNDIKNDANQVLRKFCRQELDCPNELKEKIIGKIKKFIKGDAKNLEKVSNQEILNKINFSIHKMNQDLKKTKVNQGDGFLSDWFDGGIDIMLPYALDSASPDLENEETNTNFNKYLNTYLKETSEGDGLLMHTNSIRNAMGALRTIDSEENIDEDTHLTDSTYKFEEHEEIDLDDVEDAIADMYSGIDKQIASLHKLNLSKKIRDHKLSKLSSKNKLVYPREIKANDKDRKRDLRYLLKTNPKAVSQLLSESPEYAALVCKTLIDIDRVDQNLEGSDSTFLWGGAVLGIAGLLTGGVAWLGAGVISAAGIATVGSVSSGLLIAATASGVIGGSISMTQAYNLNKEVKEIESGLLSGNAYTESSEQMRDFYNSYKNAFYDATINTTMSLAGLGALGAINRLKKSGTTVVQGNKNEPIGITPDTLKNLDDVYSEIARSKKLTKMLEKLKDKTGQNDIDEFIAKLGMLPPEMSKAFVTKLTSSKIDEDKLYEIIKKTKCK